MSINDEQLKADIERATQSGRLLRLSDFMIDLEKLLYLDIAKSGAGLWAVMDGSRWDSDGDFYHNAPWISGDDATVLVNAWARYTNRHNLQILTGDGGPNPPFKIT